MARPKFNTGDSVTNERSSRKTAHVFNDLRPYFGNTPYVHTKCGRYLWPGAVVVATIANPKCPVCYKIPNRIVFVSAAEMDALTTARNTLSLLCDHCSKFYGQHGALETCGDGTGSTFAPHPEAATLDKLIERMLVRG